MKRTPFYLARQAEFRAYDVWNSRLQKARMDIFQIRKKRNNALQAYKASPHSLGLRKKAIYAEQDLWDAETDFADLIFEARDAVQNVYISTLQGYQAPTGPSETPEPCLDTTSVSSCE